MASPRNYADVLRVALLTLILSLSLLPSQSVHSGFPSYVESLKRKTPPVLGSRPPQCDNRCSTCNPCVATVVVDPPQRMGWSVEAEERYFPESWKCACNGKIYDP